MEDSTDADSAREPSNQVQSNHQLIIPDPDYSESVLYELSSVKEKTNELRSQIQSQLLHLETAIQDIQPSVSTVTDSSWMGLSTLNIICIIIVFGMLISLSMLNYRIWRTLVDVQANTRVLVLQQPIAAK